MTRDVVQTQNEKCNPSKMYILKWSISFQCTLLLLSFQVRTPLVKVLPLFLLLFSLLLEIALQNEDISICEQSICTADRNNVADDFGNASKLQETL